MRGYAALKTIAFSCHTNLGIVKALPALGSRLAKVFQSVIEAFQLVLFPPTRVSMEDRLPACKDKSEADLTHFRPLLEKLDNLLEGQEFDIL
jgi:hypothetical protein